MLRGPSVLLKTQRNHAVLFQTRFTTIWGNEIHINLKFDAHSLNRRRLRFLLLCTMYHICQGQWRQDGRKCACIYDIWNEKNKIQKSSNRCWQYLLCTKLNLNQPNQTSWNLKSPNSFKLHNCLYYWKHNGMARFYYEHVLQHCGEAESISIYKSTPMPEPTPASLLCPPYNISCLSRTVKAVGW
jgi:hypothetical protein